MDIAVGMTPSASDVNELIPMVEAIAANTGKRSIRILKLRPAAKDA